MPPDAPVDPAPNPSRSPSPVDAPLRRATLRLDVSDAVALDGPFAIAASLVLPAPEQTTGTTPLLACLPGGFLSRHYYDLEIDGSRRYSFAERMARAGWAVVAFDHVGVGDSTLPDPIDRGYALGVEAIAAANQRALERVLEGLAAGSLVPGLPALRPDRVVGVGHSMGSMLSVEQQAAARPFDALVLYSFSTHGTPAFLDDAMRAYADDPARLRREIGALAERTMGSPFPERPTGDENDRRAAFGVGTAPEDAERALEQAATRLLACGGIASMVPGGFAPPAAEIDVPVLMVVGDHDLHDDRHTRDELPRAPRVDTFTLPDAWHCHFVANTRERLFEHTLDWLATIERRSDS